MLFKGVALLEKESEHEVRSPSTALCVPNVVRLAEYVSVPRCNVRFSRKNVFLRDQHTCQYCGSRLPVSLLTIDHVVPISRGGANSWKNVVTACKKCNNAKGDRTPKEAGMDIGRKPTVPSVYIHMSRFAVIPDNSWNEYLFADD
jgi:5-methylcytosine-specific restriction endonuclease McrA